MNLIRVLPSPLGDLTLAAEGEAITGLWIKGQKYDAATLPLDATPGELPAFDVAAGWLERYFAGGNPGDPPPLAPRGSPFRQAVWTILEGIPYGTLMTYGEIARRIEAQTGQRASAQAVGGAVGHNPISILIPCHRVVGTGGSLTGYAGGLEKKLWLLKLEGAPLEGLFLPTRGTAL